MLELYFYSYKYNGHCKWTRRKEGKKELFHDTHMNYNKNQGRKK